MPSILSTLESAARRLEVPARGRPIVWRRWGHGAGNVVLLHGGSGSWRHWCRNIDFLAQTHSVWAPDMPGFGDSPSPPGPVTIESYGRELSQGLEQLFDEERAVLDVIGFSLGSSIACQFAHAWSGSIRHLALVGCNLVGLDSTRPSGLLNPRKIADPESKRQAYRHNLALMLFADSAHIDECALDIYIEDSEKRSLPIDTFELGVGHFASLADLRLTGRLFSVSGALDRFMPAHVDQLRALRALHPSAHHQVIPGAAHWVMYEAATEFNDVLSALLRCRD